MLRAIAYLDRGVATPIAELPNVASGIVVGDTTSPRPADEEPAA